MRRLLQRILQQPRLAAATLLAGSLCMGVQVPMARADERVEICFNYGCFHHAEVVFTEADFDMVKDWLGDPGSAALERARLGRAIAMLYVAAARTTPIWRDRGGNFPFDPEESGMMDCIDHSTNTSRFLMLLEKRGLLRFHVAGERVKRMRFLAEHWAAQLVDQSDGAVYAVDSWFFDHGVPALVLPVTRWRALSDPWDL